MQKVEVQLDSGPWLTATGTTAWSYSLNSSNFLNGPHLLAARATDTIRQNLRDEHRQRALLQCPPSDYLQRISGGNTGNVPDCSGNVWLRDQAYSFGAFGYSGGTTG